MAIPSDSSEVVRFGDFRVDLRTGELWNDGRKLNLQEQPFHVLAVLLERPGQLVTRDELMKRLWPSDTFVDFDHSLNKAVNRLREVLEDSAESPRFIETLPRRGYRFIATVEGLVSIADSAEEERFEAKASPEPRPWHRRNAFRLATSIGIAAVLLIVAMTVSSSKVRHWFSAGGESPRIHSIAVLPLQNLSGDIAQEYFSDGMTDALITELAQIGSLTVISRTSTMRYKNSSKSLPEIARELNVDGIIEGTVQRSGNRVRITAQLIHGPSDKHMWANSYERNTRDIFALQRALTQDIAHEVQVRLSTQSQVPPPQPRAVEPKVLEAYLQGNYHLNSYGAGSGPEEQMRAAEYFQQAIDADPNFALAYRGLAMAHLELLWPSDQDSEIARSAAARAVELDPNSPGIQVMLGYVALRTWDFHVAEEQFRRALALSPSNAQAHDGYSYWLGIMGRGQESLREAQIAQQLNPSGNLLPMALYYAHDYDRAIAVSLALIQSDPNAGNLHWDLSRAYAAKGMYKDSITELEKMLNLSGAPESAASIHHAFLISGYRGARQQYAKELESLMESKKAYYPVEIAEVYETLGDKDRAFYWLEDAYKHRARHWAAADYHLEWINEEPLLEPLRSDPRFKDLVRRIGLPQ